MLHRTPCRGKRMIRLQYFTLAAIALRLAVGTAMAQTGGTDSAYRLVEHGGRAMLAAPGGGVLWLRALNHVHIVTAGAPRADLAPAYLDQRSQHMLAAMHRLGFNALGGDADAELWHRGLPFIQSLHLTALLEGSQAEPMVNVYASGFAAEMERLAMDACAPRATDPGLIGYFSDDSLPWDPATHAGAVLGFYLSLPLRTAGRQRAVDYLQDLYNGDIGRLDRRWGLKARLFVNVQVPAHGSPAAQRAVNADAARFAEDVLVRYLRTAASAIHAADPHHLFLGANLEFDPARPPAPGSAAAAAWTIADVNSVLIRPGQDATAVLAALARVTPRPVLAQWTGCGPPPPAALDSPRLIGFLWSPGGDWESGPCAAAAAAWGRLR